MMHDARRTTHDARRTTHDARRTTHDARRRAVSGSGKAGRHARAARVTLMRRCARPCRPAAHTTGCRRAPSRRCR
ncbi:capsule biosynthesis protein [Burkholderia contaminans]|uniref:Capsule biosynthesis protein n=1 Tax=Burkholderia contaminans TaxID=488447 RepID=A0A2S5E3S4_9BURK|nr:capsule biosynthesis protein [Burkholderia contaminans]